MVLEIEFLNSSVLERQMNVIEYILDNMKEDKILVIDTLLSPDEEKKLIEETMREVTDRFSGIEISTLSKGDGTWREKIAEMLGIKTGFTVIGPSKLIKSLKRDPTSIKLLAQEFKDDGRKR